MLEMLWRIAAFVVAILCLADATLPRQAIGVQVDRHRTEVQHTRHPAARPGWHGVDDWTDYVVDLHGDGPRACQVGRATWDSLQDGDEVVVDVTRVSHACVSVTRTQDGRVLHDAGAWRSWRFGLAALAFAIGCGVFSRGRRGRFRDSSLGRRADRRHDRHRPRGDVDGDFDPTTGWWWMSGNGG